MELKKEIELLESEIKKRELQKASCEKELEMVEQQQSELKKEIESLGYNENNLEQSIKDLESTIINDINLAKKELGLTINSVVSNDEII